MQDIVEKFNIENKFRSKNYNLAHFNKILNKVSKTQERPYPKYENAFPLNFRQGYKYELKDVVEALDNIDIIEMRKISRYFYDTNTSFRRQVDHFAQLYKYYYVADFKGVSEKTKSKKQLLKLYNLTLDFLDALNIRDIFGYITKRVLIDGAFYGYINRFENNLITITQLNPNYCRSRDTSAYGTACVEFDVRYFLKYSQNQEDLDRTLKAFPDNVKKYWNAYHAGKTTDSWCRLPVKESCAFFMDKKAVPPLYSSIIDIINFNDYKTIEKKRDSSELQKLLVQQFKLDEDGDLDVLMEEMGGMHEAVSQMLQQHDNIEVLTTIADNVDLKDTQSSSNKAGETNIQKMLLPKYENAGISSEIFYATGGTTLEYSVNNATSFMSQLIDKYSTWLSMLCYSQFEYGKIIPVVTILPITWYNQSKMSDMYLKNAQYGFSWILPYVASGKKQSTLLDNAYLEQEILNLSEVMKPLSSSFTQNGEKASSGQAKKIPGDPGRPEKPMEEKSDKTIANINAQQ